MQVTLERGKASDAEAWDSLVASNAAGTFFQTAEYAEALGALRNVEPLYFKATEDGAVLGVLLAFRETLWQQVFEEKTHLRPLAPVFKKFFPCVRWVHGPLVFDSSRREEVAARLVGALSDYCKSSGAYSAEGLPPFHAGDAGLDAVFSSAGFAAKPSATFLLDLTRGVDALKAGLRKSARKAVEDCEQQGVTVSKAATEGELQDYLDLLESFRRRSGLMRPPFYPHRAFWRKQKGRAVDVYLARQNGQTVSGMGVVYFNGIIFEVAVARDLDCSAYAQDAIKWAIINEGAERGFRAYDLGGVSPDPQTQKEKGVYQFKAKWGGELALYNAYQKFYSGRRRSLVNAAKRVFGGRK